MKTSIDALNNLHWQRAILVVFALLFLRFSIDCALLWYLAPLLLKAQVSNCFLVVPTTAMLWLVSCGVSVIFAVMVVVSRAVRRALATEGFEIAELQRARAAHLKEAEKGKATPRKKSKSVVGVLKGIPLQIFGSSAGVFLASMVTPAVISSRSVEALATYSLVFVMSNVLVSLFFALVPFERLYLRESTEVSLTDSEPKRGTLAGVARAAQHQISVKLCQASA